MSARTQPVTVLAFCYLVSVGCGGSPPPASPSAEPQSAPASVVEPAPAPEPAASTEGAESAPEPNAEPPAAETTPSAEPAATEPEGPGEGRKPIDVLTAPTVAFMINYAGSAPKENAERTCQEKEAEDLQARAECIKKARDDFVADVLVFKKAGGRWSWVIYRRKKSDLLEVSTSQIDFADEKANSVMIKVKGDKGQRPLFGGRKDAFVSVPSSSTIELDDPKHGHLVYEAKVGLVNRDD